MSKFYLISIVFHAAVIFGFFMERVVELPPLKEGGSVRVSLALGSGGIEGAAAETEKAVETPAAKAEEHVPAEPQVQTEQVEVAKAVEEVKPVEVPAVKAEAVAKPELPKPIPPKPVKKETVAAAKNSKPKSVKKAASSAPAGGSVQDELQSGGRFTLGSDGIYTASSSEGIDYEFIKTVDPVYPSLAKKMRYKGEAIVKTRFLVGLTGEIEKIEIIGGVEKFGFKEEAKAALAQWKFKPIFYKGKNIKVYFYKDFKFKV